MLIREFIKEKIIDVSELKTMNLLFNHQESIFIAEKYHITMFRVNGNLDLKKIYDEFSGFTFGEAEFNCLDISTRFEYEENGFYAPLHRLNFL